MTKKCSKRAWCSAMKKFADDQYGTGKRIFVTQTMNINSLELGNAAAYQFGKKREFVWLNYCPWCGGPASFFPKNKKRTNTENGGT